MRPLFRSYFSIRTLYLAGRQSEKALVSGPCWYALLRKQKPVLSLELSRDIGNNSRVLLGTSPLLQVAYTMGCPTPYSGLGKSSGLVLFLHPVALPGFWIRFHIPHIWRCLSKEHWCPQCSLPGLRMGPTSAATNWVRAAGAPPPPTTAFVFISAFHGISHVPCPFPANAEM